MAASEKKRFSGMGEKSQGAGDPTKKPAPNRDMVCVATGEKIATGGLFRPLTCF